MFFMDESYAVKHHRKFLCFSFLHFLPLSFISALFLNSKLMLLFISTHLWLFSGRLTLHSLPSLSDQLCGTEICSMISEKVLSSGLGSEDLGSEFKPQRCHKSASRTSEQSP